jgi:hypothetical protein
MMNLTIYLWDMEIDFGSLEIDKVIDFGRVVNSDKGVISVTMETMTMWMVTWTLLNLKFIVFKVKDPEAYLECEKKVN